MQPFTLHISLLLDGRVILKWILKKWDGGSMDRIDLAQIDRCQAPLNTVVNLQVP
jgi:hypothetical protein